MQPPAFARSARPARTVLGGLLLALLAAAVPNGPAAAAAADTGPELKNFPEALLYSVTEPTATPLGANDWDCTPSRRHPRPVVLVHGTAENRFDNWALMSPTLADAGWCVFALNYNGLSPTPFYGTRDIGESALELGHFVDRVLRRTGARQVDLVGHSQGGMMPRRYLRVDDSAARKVHDLVALAPSNYGTTASGVLPVIGSLPGGEVVLGVPCFACVQQREGSDFLRDLNRGPDTVAGVRYTVIATTHDEVVTPWRNAFLRDGRAAYVRNISLQDRCPADQVEHLGISYDPVAIRLVRNALDPATARPPTCP